jgi:hypothetical protein
MQRADGHIEAEAETEVRMPQIKEKLSWQKLGLEVGITLPAF